MLTRNQIKKRLKEESEKLPILSIDEHNARIMKIREEDANVVKLSILIPTTKDRRGVFNVLCQTLYAQIEAAGYRGAKEEWRVKLPQVHEDGSPVLSPEGNQMYELRIAMVPRASRVEIVWEEDEGQMSIGEKWWRLMEKAKGEYLCRFDSDDMPSKDYVSSIMEALKENPDCVSLRGIMTTDGNNPELFEHSLKYTRWRTTNNPIKYERYPNHLNPIRSSIAKQFKPMPVSFGEDHIWAEQVYKSGLLKKEVYIDKVLYHYQFKSKK